MFEVYVILIINMHVQQQGCQFLLKSRSRMFSIFPFFLGGGSGTFLFCKDDQMSYMELLFFFQSILKPLSLAEEIALHEHKSTFPTQ